MGRGVIEMVRASSTCCTTRTAFADVNARVAALRLVPDLVAVHQLIGLAPQPHLRQVAEVPAVADDAVLASACCPVTNVDCTEHVTAGRIVVSGRSAPASRNASRFGVCSPISSGVRPDDVEHHGRVHERVLALRVRARRLTAQHRVAFEELALIEPTARRRAQRRRSGRSARRSSPGSSSRSVSIAASDDARLSHGSRRLRHLERIAHAPVRRAC